MLQFTRWKIIAILLTCLAGFLVAMPNFFSKETVASWPSFMPKKQLPLGLDLQGGAHLLLAMDQDEIKKDWINNLRDEARKVLREAKIGVTGIGTQGTQLVVKLAKPDERDAAIKALHKVRQPIGSAILGTGGYDVDVIGPDDPARSSSRRPKRASGSAFRMRLPRRSKRSTAASTISARRNRRSCARARTAF